MTPMKRLISNIEPISMKNRKNQKNSGLLSFIGPLVPASMKYNRKSGQFTIVLKTNRVSIPLNILSKLVSCALQIP